MTEKKEGFWHKTKEISENVWGDAKEITEDVWDETKNVAGSIKNTFSHQDKIKDEKHSHCQDDHKKNFK